jgi:hypothetical protein
MVLIFIYLKNVAGGFAKELLGELQLKVQNKINHYVLLK